MLILMLSEPGGTRVCRDPQSADPKAGTSHSSLVLAYKTYTSTMSLEISNLITVSMLCYCAHAAHSQLFRPVCSKLAQAGGLGSGANNPSMLLPSPTRNASTGGLCHPGPTSASTDLVSPYRHKPCAAPMPFQPSTPPRTLPMGALILPQA